MLELDALQVIIQGGAVGLLATGFFFGYKFLCKCLEFVTDLVGNHLSEVTEKMDAVAGKLDKHLEITNRLLDLLSRKD